MRNSEAPLSSVDRALRLILLLREQGSLSVTEAASALEVTPPTAYRLLTALKNQQFATQDPNRRYRPGANLASQTSTLLSPRTLRRLLRPQLTAVQSQLNETVNLWILEGIYVRNFDGIESTEELAVRVNAYDRIPAYRSAAGKALLAALTNREVEQMHAQGLPKWRSERVTSIAALKRHLHTVRQHGYATNLEEASQGVCGVGVAVHSPDGSAIVALSSGVPSTRFSPARRKEIAAALMEAAQAMSGVLAGSEHEEHVG
jgi:DNA-binding IclR family transcriptional regulator